MKKVMYGDYNNIIGFKINIRCLYDLKNQEVNICSIEVCLPNTDEKRILSDTSKLLREGCVNTTGLLTLCSNDLDDKYSWICQMCGLQAFFSTITYVSDDLFVTANQFTVAFPTCIDELELFEESMKQLVYFKNNTERVCEFLKYGKNAIKRNSNVAFHYYSNTPRSGVKYPAHEASNPSATVTWYTPPGGQRSHFVISQLNVTTYSENIDTRFETDSEDFGSD